MPLTNQLPGAYTYRAEVVFDRELGELGRAQISAPVATPVPSGATLLAVQTQKSLRVPEGKFVLSLNARDVIADKVQSWVDVLRPNDRATIRLTRQRLDNASLPDEDETVMVGFVDSVQEQRGVDANSGTPVTVATVTGTDYTKLFRQTKVSNDLYLENVNERIFIAQLKDVDIKEFDGEQLVALIKYIFAQGFIAQKFGADANNPIRLLWENNYRIVDGRYLTYQGDMWGLLETVANRPFNELWLDTLQRVPTVVFRPTPFDAGRFRELRRNAIDRRRYWSTRTLSRTDAEVVNVFQVYSQVFNLPLNVKPLVIKESLRLYGLRQMMVYVSILPDDAKVQETLKQAKAGNASIEDQQAAADATNGFLGVDLAGKLAEWFGRKSAFENPRVDQKLFKAGNLPMILSPSVRIGQVAELTDLKELYYVEGVAHRVEVKKSGTTVLTLTRGQPI